MPPHAPQARRDQTRSGGGCVGDPQGGHVRHGSARPGTRPPLPFPRRLPGEPRGAAAPDPLPRSPPSPLPAASPRRSHSELGLRTRHWGPRMAACVWWARGVGVQEGTRLPAPAWKVGRQQRLSGLPGGRVTRVQGEGRAGARGGNPVAAVGLTALRSPGGRSCVLPQWPAGVPRAEWALAGPGPRTWSCPVLRGPELADGTEEGPSGDRGGRARAQEPPRLWTPQCPPDQAPPASWDLPGRGAQRLTRSLRAQWS